MIKILLFITAVCCGTHSHAQWIEKELRTNDPRYTITYKYSLWTGFSEWEEVKFYVQNHTGQELQMVVDATIDWTCGRSASFKLGYNKVVYMKPNGRFEANSDDWVHSKQTSKEKKECIITIGDKKYTTVSNISVQVSNIRDLTVEKARAQADKEAKAAALEIDRADKAAALAADKAAKAAALEKDKAAKAAALEAAKAAKANTTANANANSSSTKNNSGNSQATNKGSGGSANTANSNPNIVNGIDRSKLPALGVSKDGKYYKKDDNNNYQEIDYDTYTAAKKQQTAARQANANATAAATQKTNEQVVADFKVSQQAATDKYFNDIAESNRKIEAKSALGMQSYYAAQAVKDLQDNLSSSTKLNGNYSSIEELQAEFREKYNSINQQVNGLVEARNQNLQASANYSFSDADAKGQLIGQGIVAVGSIINSANAEREKREARAELERQRSAEEAKIKAKQRALMLQLRNSFLGQFPDGGVPLSSHKVSTNDLYFFSYVFDKNKIAEGKPLISVSNVFSISRYGDGTWPFKATLQNDIKKLEANGAVTLIGYYASKDAADNMQKSFIDMAGQSGFMVKNIAYKGKKSSGSSSPGNDFWGNSNNQKNVVIEPDILITEVPESKNKKPADDFWETGKKTANPKPAPAKKPVKKDDDFWKN